MNAYSALAKYYDSLIEYPYEKVADIVKEEAKGKALDLFCGTGRFSMELCKRGFEVQGSDISEEMLNVAMSNARDAGLKIIFKKENAVKFSFREGTTSLPPLPTG